VRREIAIIGGTGEQGFGLALRWAQAGERILIGSRDKEKAERAAQKARQAVDFERANVEGVENGEAVSRANTIVLTVPFAAQAMILKGVKKNFKGEDLLIDVTVPLETAFGGQAARVFTPWCGSAAEQAAELVPPGVTVVSAFHHVGANVLQDLSQKINCDIIVCGNSREGKESVKALIKLIPGAGFVDGGPLENSRIVGALTALLVSINIRYKVKNSGIRITGLNEQTNGQ
jgi:NADPH-dependent F420 reductase